MAESKRPALVIEGFVPGVHPSAGLEREGPWVPAINAGMTKCCGSTRGVFDRDLHVRLLRDTLSLQPLAFDRQDFQLDRKVKAKRKEGKAKIRCPICRWQPTKAARWYCLPMGAPENFTGGCGKRWHTFDTRGLCPSCSYQWKHTTCLRCSGTSLHEEWYEQEKKGGS